METPDLEKTDLLHNLIRHQPDIDKIYLYTRDPYEAKHQLLIDRRKGANLKHCNDSKAFIKYPNDMDDTFQNIEKYNPNNERKVLLVSDDMIADILSNKETTPVVTELFIRRRKLNISLVFITQSYVVIPKNIRLNSTRFYIMKFSNKRELQQTTFNHSLDTDIEDFMNLYKKIYSKIVFFSSE